MLRCSPRSEIVDETVHQEDSIDEDRWYPNSAEFHDEIKFSEGAQEEYGEKENNRLVLDWELCKDDLIDTTVVISARLMHDKLDHRVEDLVDEKEVDYRCDEELKGAKSS